MINFNTEQIGSLCRKYGISLLILHGSYAKGTITPHSDVDVGIMGESALVKERYFDILNDFVVVFGDKFDPVFINGAEAMIAYQIALNGTPLYEKTKGAFNEFKVNSIARYMDTRKFRILEKKYIASVIRRNGGLHD